MRPCSYAPRLEGAAAMEMPVAMARLQLVPGIGPWARRRGLPTHPWGPDALTLGDLHLPVQIGYALTGARRGTGEQTLQLLQPYAGQRYRAARLILINAGPDAWYRGDPRKLGVETNEEWWAATRNPDVVRAMLEDYRAGLTIDRERKRRITPGAVDPRDTWQHWAHDLQGHGIDSGHHMAEEAPPPALHCHRRLFHPLTASARRRHRTPPQNHRTCSAGPLTAGGVTP
ncbi:hypothetical protein GCM10010328_20330 [Streptomyces rubiginosohelvolus]|uniref:Uncharacterized protein n=1 Tax=Streptomyces rubiginosohelvolus TaxID=67362 RepID=A0ABQ3BLU9_9ACTN|nr:hypothetical protein GCM10010328_20330 [Streptomyces pluricolorescens]